MLRPIVQSVGAEPLDGPAFAVLLDHSPCGEDVVLGARADEGEGGGAERELEQPPSERRDVIVVALGRGLGDDLDLAIGESEALVHLAARGVLRLGIGQIELGWAGLEDYVAMRRVGDLAEALGREHDGRVFLAQRAQPLLDLRAEDAVGEHHPGFVENDERRAAIEALIDSME